MGTISKNFDYSEFEVTTYPELVDKNRITDPDILANVKALVETVLQPLRDSLGVPVIVNSGYRCKEVNERAGGVSNSQHQSGSAADIRTKEFTPVQIVGRINELSLPYDQLILYKNFVHVSHVRDGKQRIQFLDYSAK